MLYDVICVLLILVKLRYAQFETWGLLDKGNDRVHFYINLIKAILGYEWNTVLIYHYFFFNASEMSYSYR